MDFENLKGLKLREALEKLPKDINVEVGTAGGSGFWWIGKAGTLLEHINDVSDKLYDAWRMAIDGDLRKLEKRKPQTFGQFVCSQLRARMKGEDYVKPDIAHYLDYVSRFDKRTEFLAEFTANKVKHYKAFTPLAQRKLNDAFQACEPVEAAKLIVSGHESGKWWFTGEKEKSEQTGTQKEGEAGQDWSNNFAGVIRTPKSD